MTPAIVLTSGFGGLALIRSLGAMGVPVVAAAYSDRDFSLASRYVRDVWLAPHPEHAEQRCIEFLLERAAGHRGSLLIPTADEWVLAVARHRERLKDVYVVACPDWQVAQRFIDKPNTYALAQRLGVPTPKTTLPASTDDVRDYAESVDFPCLLKPRQSHDYYARFQRKLVMAHSPSELVAAYEEAAGAGFGVMLQEYIPGPDDGGANYNSYWADGEPLAEFTAQKIRLSPPVVGRASVVVSRDLPQVAQSGRRLVAAMGVEGFSCTEFKRDARDGVYKLMELNGRHNMSSALAVRAGVDFPRIMYRHLVRGERPRRAEALQGVYWIDGLGDLLLLRAQLSDARSAFNWLRPYLAPHVFASLDVRDLAPFVRRLRTTAGRVLRQ